MDVEKILEFATDNLAQYWLISITTLSHPSQRFADFVEELQGSVNDIRPSNAYSTGPRLTPKLFLFAVTSIIIGTSLDALLLRRDTSPSLFATVLAVLLFWLLFSTGVFWGCKLLRGKGNYVETLSVSVQIFSVVYVVSHVGALLIAAGAKLPYVKDLEMSKMITMQPIIGYFLLSAPLLTIYLPLSLKYVHRFGWKRQLIVGFLTLCAQPANFAIYLAYGFPTMVA